MENVELQATCAALGYLEGDVYQKEPDCLETVKDLIRFLKREDETCDIRRQLGHSEILQRDLLPIIKQYNDNKDRLLIETVLRLMVNLTQPAKLCFQNQIPEDKTMRNYYLEVESHLQAYKEAFVDEELFAVLTKRLGDLLQLDWENRQEEDRLLIERILILLRNILHVPPNINKEQRTDDDASVHDQVLWALHISGMEDLLLFLASSPDERQFAFHVLEIISLMFREQTPEQLSQAGVGRSLTEKQQDTQELALQRQQEQAERLAALRKLSTRHSRFGGTFIVKNIKSVSDKELIYHRSLGRLSDIDFDYSKKPRKCPKNRQRLTERDLTRRSTLSIRLFLKEFCIQFLENCYNPLMATIKDSLLRSKAQENDETYYLWAMRFFMEFNRHHNFRVELISETLSVPAFHYIQTHLQNFHEMILTSKKEGIIWSRRMHLALKAYHELLQSLNLMDKSEDESLHEGARVMKCNIFYMTEYRDIFVILLRKFDETRQSRVFLRDLIETTHLFLRMIENFKKSNRHLVVQRKKKKIVRRKKNSKDNKADDKKQMTDEELADLWDDVSSELSAIFQGRLELPGDVTPFDAASGVEVNEQRASTMHRIQRALREKHPAEAVALFRAAREVWPDGEFGSLDISPEDEFMALREVFFTSFPGADVDTNTQNTLDETQDDIEDDIYAEEFEQQEDRHVYCEEEFNFKEFVKRFCQPHIVKSYIILLSGYKENSVHTNHCIVKMLHRIAVDLQLVGMIFQASLFRIMEKILTDPGSNIKQFKELRTFAKYVVRKFVEVAQNNPKVFVEIFFWSTMRESVEITQGYGTYTNQVKTLWTEEQDEELRQLYEEYKDNHEEGMDVVDHIMIHIVDQTKTRRQVIRQLVHLDLIGSAKELKKKTSATRKPYVREWREEEELELRQLFEEYKASLDPVGSIIAHMLHPRSKNRVVEKLMELGLVSDRKQLYKKRKSQAGEESKKRNNKKHEEGQGSEGQDDMDVSVSEQSVNRQKARPVSGNDNTNDSEHHGIVLTDDSDDDSYGDEDDDDDDDGDTPLFVKKIKQIVRRCYEDGLQSSVQWIRQCLQRVADDKDDPDDDYDEAVPIVPVLDEQEEAMESDTFMRLLKRCGISAPDNIQEKFWRIPAHMTAADLRVRVQALSPPGEKDCQPKTSAGGRLQILKDLVLQKKQALTNRRKKNIEKRQKQLEATSEPEDGSQLRADTNKSFSGDDQSQDQSSQSRDLASQSDGNSQHSHPSPQPISGKRKRSRIQRSLDSDSEQSSVDEEPVILMADRSNQNVDKKQCNQPAKRARLLESDSDSGTEKENIPKDSLSKQESLESHDSDVDEKISRKHSRVGVVVESDSDE